LVVIAFVRFERLRSVENYFIVGLSCTDLLLGLLIPVRDILDLGFWNSEGTKYPCLVGTFLVISMSNISLWTLMLIAVERFVKIFKPLHYHLYYTPRRVVAMLTVTWSVLLSTNLFITIQEHWRAGQRCLVVSVLPKKMADIALPMLAFLPIVTTSFVYSRIFLLARKHERSIRGLQVLCHQVSVNPSSSNPSLHQRTQSSFSSSDRKRLKMMMAVMGVLYISWTPYCTVKFLLKEKTLDYRKWDSFSIAYEFASKLIYFNSFLNPLIY
ncbi:hypothetical protein CAPTEDRAFT_37194, partial [Capitella teleta]